MNDMSSNDSLKSVMQDVLAPAGLQESHLNRALGSINMADVDAADLYFQLSRQESWSFEDGRLKEGSFNLDHGVGVRAVSGEKTGFAYSDELLLPSLERAAKAARAISRQGNSRAVRIVSRGSAPALYPAVDPTSSISDDRKTALLGDIDAAVRALDERISQVMISLNSVHDLVLIAAADDASQGKNRSRRGCQSTCRTRSHAQNSAEQARRSQAIDRVAQKKAGGSGQATSSGSTR
jgi:TldD protein